MISLHSPRMPRLRRPVLIGLIAIFVTALCGGFHASPYNNYVLLAQAMLGGHVWINWPGPYIDALAFNGQHYIIEAPVPAILLMPFVAIWGVLTNQSWLGLALVGISTGAAWSLATRLGIAENARRWLVLFFFAGTDLFWCASLGDVWLIAHLAAVAATMLALHELAGPRRPWLVGIWACAAAGSRFSLVLALPIYVAMLLDATPLRALEGHAKAPTGELRERAKKRILTPYLGVVAVWLIAMIFYNEARWQLPYDIGYTAWYHQDGAGNPTGSPFQLQYFAYQLQSFFVNLPTWLGHAPWLEAPIIGQSLFFTSPALVLAFFARGARSTLCYFWALTTLVAAPSFIYYVDGFAQFGMRHALDFEPFLFVLMALAVRGGMPWWGKILCGYSAVVGAWGVWYWHAVIGRPWF